MKQQHAVNRQIKGDSVRLIGEDGTNLGIIEKEKALGMAKKAKKDLVQISESNDFSVCKIMDFSRFKYENQKKMKEAKKKQRQVRNTLKELYVRPVTSQADLNRQIQKGIGFLESGHTVKFGIKFRGREMSHKDMGIALLDQIKESIKGVGKIDNDVSQEGRNLSIMISPCEKVQS